MIPIVVPTHGRAGRVTTHTVIDGVILCVAASQEAAYRAAYPDIEMVVHPDDVAPLAVKRQWIWDRYGDVFMVDDDVTVVFDHGQENGARLSPTQAVRVINELYDIAEQMGVYMFGFSLHQKPTYYREHRPFSFSSFISAHAMGLRAGSRLFFHPDLSLADDIFLHLLNAHYHRANVVNLRYTFDHKDTFKGEGGLASLRNEATMKETYEILERTFGSPVITKNPMKGKGSQTSEWIPNITLPWSW